MNAIKTLDTVTLTPDAASMLEVDGNTLYTVTDSMARNGVRRLWLTPVTEPPTLNATLTVYVEDVAPYRG